MEETKLDRCIFAIALLVYRGIGAWGGLCIRKAKRMGKLPPADKKFLPALLASAGLLALPFLIYFKPFVTAVLEGCAVLGLYITLRERLGRGTD